MLVSKLGILLMILIIIIIIIIIRIIIIIMIIIIITDTYIAQYPQLLKALYSNTSLQISPGDPTFVPQI